MGNAEYMGTATSSTTSFSQFQLGEIVMGSSVGRLKAAAALLSAVLIAEIALAIWLPLRDKSELNQASRTYHSVYSGTFENAAVAADSAICSSLGSYILQRGGNAVDATITTALCSGVQNMQSCGIGGGSFMLIHDEANSLHKFINCRETAPASASRNMFVNGVNSSTYGAAAIAIPGEMKCMSEAHEKYGKLEWSELIDPIIDLVRNGVYVTETSVSAFNSHWTKIIGLADIFSRNGGPLQVGDQFVNEQLAQTFEQIRDNKNAFYSSPLADDIVKDINDNGGKFELDDLANYAIDESNALKFEFGDYIGYVGAPPSSGVILAFIVNIMHNFKERGELPNERNADFFHKLAEASKFAYGKRSLLGDRHFQPDNFTELVNNLTSYEYATDFYHKILDEAQDFDYYEPAFEIVEDAGTSHMSVVDQNGQVCALTSTINTGLGSKVVGEKTGIIFNNEMDDFSTPNLTNFFGVPPSPANFIEPGKRPQSSMTPVVITRKNGEIVFTGGASGGTRITTATALVITSVLMQDYTLNQAIQMPRIHHQLAPNLLRYELRLNDQIVADLVEIYKHEVESGSASAVCQAILSENGSYTAASDSRKGGRPDGF